MTNPPTSPKRAGSRQDLTTQDEQGNRLKHNARALRHAATTPESRLWTALRNRHWPE